MRKIATLKINTGTKELPLDKPLTFEIFENDEEFEVIMKIGGEGKEYPISTTGSLEQAMNEIHIFLFVFGHGMQKDKIETNNRNNYENKI